MEAIDKDILNALKKIEDYCLDELHGCRRCKYHDICRKFPFQWQLEREEEKP